MSYKFGIIGYPLSHSMSPVMQQAALKSVNVEGSYDLLETEPEDLISRIKMLKTQNYDGFNVTIPHKVPMTLFLSQVDEYANFAGCVNTVKINADKSLQGFNTDVYGFVKAIPDDIELENTHVAILGTGGVARAAVVGFVTKNVAEISLYTRNIVDSHRTAELFRQKFPKVKINLIQNELLTSLENFKVVVNATPLGMRSFRAGISPLNDELVKTLADDSLIYDLIYNPIKTALIEQAIKAGKRYAGGLDMLVYQGARAFEIWTGEKPDTDKMKIAVLENLEQR